MVFSDPNDFRIKNHDFSDPASNCVKRVIEAVQNVKISVFFRSEAPPNLSARAKKNSEGAPGFAERENPRPETRAGENGGQGARTPALQRLHRTVCFARLLRTSRKTGRTYTLRKRNGEGSEGEPRREKGPRDGNTAAAAWRWRGT